MLPSSSLALSPNTGELAITHSKVIVFESTEPVRLVVFGVLWLLIKKTPLTVLFCGVLLTTGPRSVLDLSTEVANGTRAWWHRCKAHLVFYV